METITITKICPFCGKAHTCTVDRAGYFAWECGELAQRALPNATPTEREQLISGICPKCQESIFGSSSEPDDEPLPFEDCPQNCQGCRHYDECFADEGEDTDDCDYECGFDPYAGCYTDDC